MVPRVMRMAWPRWRATALAFLGLETVAVFWAYYTFGVGSRVHQAVSSPWVSAVLGSLLAMLETTVPPWLAATWGTFLATIGLTSPLERLVSLGTALGSGTAISSLGSALVAPTYFVVRRLWSAAGARTAHAIPAPMASPTSARADPGPATAAAEAKLFEPNARASTSVQEAL